MKHLQLLLWILGFMILNLFANGIPFIISHYPETKLSLLFIEQPYYWILFWISFFVLSFLISKFIFRLKGLSSMGLKLQKSGIRDAGIGFLIGSFLWIVKNLFFFSTGMFEVAGVIDFSAIPGFLAMALLISFFPAAVNDLLIRGYFFSWFKRYNLLAYFVFTTSFVYALDDFWQESFSITNLIFSFVLGVSLAITVMRTGAIWMAIGKHTGSNLVYRMMYGLDGQGILILDNLNSNHIYDYINILFVVFLIPIVLVFSKSRLQNLESETGKIIINKNPETI